MRLAADGRILPESRPARHSGRTTASGVGLIRKLQRVFYLNAEKAHGALKLAVAEQKLHGAQLLRAPAELHDVACPQLAVDAEVEESKVPQTALELQTNPDSPNLPQSEGGLLPDQLALVPWRPWLAGDGQVRSIRSWA